MEGGGLVGGLWGVYEVVMGGVGRLGWGGG